MIQRQLRIKKSSAPKTVADKLPAIIGIRPGFVDHIIVQPLHDRFSGAA
jgi:hypothetical protein